jgi:murein L,D-transpeptidase YcbB/YkuD
LAVVAGLVAGLVLAPLIVPAIVGRPNPLAEPIRHQLIPGEPLEKFYRARGDRPLWITRTGPDPAAFQLVAALRGAGQDNLDPRAYHPEELATAISRPGRDHRSLARTEIALSRAFAAYAVDLHRPIDGAEMKFVDPAIRMPPTSVVDVLRQAAAAPSMTDALRSARRMNRLYVQLRSALDARRASGERDRTTRLIEANLERARALPPDLGQRFVLVNAPAERLWFYDRGRVRGGMRVVVGKRDNPTPQMIGLIRYALFNPSWNVPPDLVRKSIAPAVLRRGPTYLQARHFQAMTPTPIDWSAVADGALEVHVRQLPGPDNMMGHVKFMLPNPLGIYLHDTPQKGLFSLRRRADSHGCVRLQHPGWLVSWLFTQPLVPGRLPDQEIDLPSPTPVYIVYLTLAPTARGLSPSPDIYGLDRAMLARLAARHPSRG